MKKLIFLAFIAVFISACNVNPEPIVYGVDACHFCEMTIVDKQFASQVVTSKGKAYKYDAIECMVHSLQDEFADTEMKHYLVMDYNKPGEPIDATNATFLISEKIQSPMGANLAAFQNEDSGNKAKEKLSGNTYSWKQIQDFLKL